MYTPAPDNPLKHKLAWSLPILAGVGWGIVGVFIRILTEEGLDNITIIVVRNLVGMLLAGIWLVGFRREELRIDPRDIPIIVLSTVAGSVLLMLAYNIAVVELSLSLAAVLLSTAPVFVLLVSAVLFKERITLRKVLCMIGALAGCVMLSGVLETAGLSWSGIGLLMGVLSMVFNGTWILLSKVVADKGYSSFTICFYSFLFAVIMLGAFADWGAVGNYIAAKPLEACAALLGQSLCTSLLPSIAYIVGLRYLDAGKTAILEGGAEPAGALLMGIVLYSEIPTPLGTAGMILTVIALGVLAGESKDRE